MNTEATIIDNDSGIAIPADTQKSIAVMNEVASGLAELKTKYAAMPDVNTDEGYELAKQERKEIGAVRIKIDKAHKAGKAFYLEGGRKIDGMKNDILKIVTTLEDERKEAIKAIDDEAARIAQEAAEKEQVRIEGIESRIARIKSAPSDAVTLEQVNSAIEKLATLKAHGTYDAFDEFKDAARGVIEEAEIALTEKKTALEAQAAEAAQLEEQRLEQERIAAKNAEDARILAEKAAAAEKAEADRKAAIAAEDADRAAKIKREDEEREAAEAARLAAIEKARTDAIAEKAAAEQKVIDDEAERVRVEAEKAKAVEKAREQAIADEQARQQAEADKQAEEQAERERLAAEAPDKEQLLAWIESLPQIPAMKTKAGKAAADAALASLGDITDMIMDMGKRSKKAA